MEELQFDEPRTVLFAVGDKDAIDTKLCWRWARDNFFLPSDNIWLVRCRQKTAGWIPMDTVKTLSDVSLAKDWLPEEIAHSIKNMPDHKLLIIETTHDAGDALIKFIQLEVPQDATLLMGSHGRQGWRKIMLGSVSSYVVQHSRIPVLVVRSRKYKDIPDLTSDTVGSAYLGMTAQGKQRKIALAVDGTDSSAKLVKWAMKNCLKPGDEIHILHSAASETISQTLQAAAEINSCMALLEAFQKGSDTGTATSILLDVKGGDIRDKLVDYVEDSGGAIDLLVMGSRGIKGNLKRAVIGSVTSYCLSYANCPVIVVPRDVAEEVAGPSADVMAAATTTPTA